MAWPMVASVLDSRYAHLFVREAHLERSVIVFGAMESALTPLMEALEREHPIKVFSLPSVDHPEWGRHIELGVKGAPAAVEQAFRVLREALVRMELSLGPDLVRS